MFHWEDCQRFGSVYPNATEDELVAYIQEWAHEKLDENGINEYDIVKQGSYASDKYIEGRYDEAYVEFRVNQVLRREK